jgi:hypothetical protein
MAVTVEGSEDQGFRVLSEDGAALTGRFKTKADALAAAGVKPEPAKKAAPAKKSAK